jgi:hypothetical protein
MANERDLTADAQAEQAAVTNWVVQAYKTVYQAGLAILRGFGMPGDEASRSFVTAAVQYVEDILRMPRIPLHVKHRVVDDLAASLDQAAIAVHAFRDQLKAEEADQNGPAPDDNGGQQAGDGPGDPGDPAPGSRLVPDPDTDGEETKH